VPFDLNKNGLADFIKSGGIEKIGHRAYALLSFLVEKAKEEGYPEVIEISVQETKYKANLPDDYKLKRARDTLITEGLISSYEPNRDTGFYYLNYK